MNLVKEIQKRSRIQPGMLVNCRWSTNTAEFSKKLALVVGLSPGCKFDRDYPEAEEHLFYSELEVEVSNHLQVVRESFQGQAVLFDALSRALGEGFVVPLDVD